MSYGSGAYGGSPWGGYSLESGAPVLASSNPIADATGVSPLATIQFTIATPSDLDLLTLNVLFSGAPIILAGEFLPGYGGTIEQANGLWTITVSTHPLWVGGVPLVISISVLNLSGLLGNLTYQINISNAVILATETVSISESISLASNARVTAVEMVPISEGPRSLSGTLIEIPLPQEFRYERSNDPARFSITALDGGTPLTVFSALPLVGVVASGSGATVGAFDPGSFGSHTVVLPGASLSAANVGDYVNFIGPAGALNEGITARIEEALSATSARVDKVLFPLDSHNGSLTWAHTSGVRSILLVTNKSTNDKSYRVSYSRLLNKRTSEEVYGDALLVATSPRPHVSSATFLPDGDVLVTFGEEMRSDSGLVGAADYSITGPSTVRVLAVVPVSDRVVRVVTAGMAAGSYTLTINATGTPHDVAGNPIDATFNTAVFTGAIPLNQRSIFTDKGPIAKPALTVQSGATATVSSLTEITCPGATFSSPHVGLYLTLEGSANGGTYRVTGVVSATKLRLQASFTLPDASSGSLSWRLYDPRDGEIADDPADVTVRVNGTPVTATAVIGLLGQVVLPTPPIESDDVKIDYSWVSNPTVDFRRLNSKEFVLNGSGRDLGKRNPSQHTYRVNSSLIRPSSYNPTDIAATLAQPKERDLFYRAYERAYTASLNDPTTLVLNTPTHRIAYPPLSRTVDSVDVLYSADVLPESDPFAPWTRIGSGTATVAGGSLTISDDSTGTFPTGRPLFWSRAVDLTFQHVFAASWRMQLPTVTTAEGVWTGLAVGWSNDVRAVVMGFLIDGGVKKIGFLKAGGGNDPSLLTSWAGGFDSLGVATGAPVAFDWSILHSYRLYRDRDGNVRLYVDGEVVEALRVVESALPFLEELNDPFKGIQGVFWGSFSRAARQTSVWDFLRYVILPTNPAQSAPSRFTNYEADQKPEETSDPWTPVGYHGTETLLSPDTLLLDSTSATTQATEDLVGLVGGDFRGFGRMEPLLSISSDVVLDINVQLRTLTHGITPNALMAAIDDGDRLVQLSFFADKASPKVSYPGRSLPEDATPTAWLSMGTAPVALIGRILRVMDASTTDGRIYYVDDAPLVSDAARIATPTSSYMFEFRANVVSFTADGAGFCGVTADIFDGDASTTGRSLGIMLRTAVGVKYVALHSDGAVVAQWAFNWFDGKPHTYRLVRTQTGTPVVSLFVDGVFVGASNYSLFTASTGPGIFSWGSSTSSSTLSLSVVDWHYANSWRVLDASTARWVGLWKGYDDTSLLGYHLPTKVAVQPARVAGNVLHDDYGDFLARGVVAGDPLLIDDGPNAGVYAIVGVASATDLTIAGVFPVAPTEVRYRIPLQVDWATAHKYRIIRDPGGSVSVFLDAQATPLIRVGYTNLDLPSSTLGFPRKVNASVPSIMFGAFDPTNLSQSSWDYVRYGITRSPSELRIVPHHEILNQRNVMASPEHLTTDIPHTHSDFWSSSTGIPNRSLYDDDTLTAFTRLNEGTPLVPSTQNWQVRRPTPVFESTSGLNRPEDVLNFDRDFLLNDGTGRIRLLVPKDVLYTSLEVIERAEGDVDLIAPLDDDTASRAHRLNYTKEVCLSYDGATLPEDSGSDTPWVLASDDPSQVTTASLSGILTYQTGGIGTRTIYRNATPLPDALSLTTEVKFRLKLLRDGTAGTGDTGVRYGFSAFGFTCALAWITDHFGNRLVQLIDVNSGAVLSQVPFDFDDGSYHVYRFVKAPSEGLIHFYIDG